MGADVEGRGQLAEAGVEAERQCREDHVIGDVPEVVADAGGARPAGCGGSIRRPSACPCSRRCRRWRRCRCRGRPSAGAVHARVRRNRPTSRSSDAGPPSGPSLTRRRRPRRAPPAARLARSSRSSRESFGRGHEHADVAVGQDVPDLPRTKDRIDRNEDTPSRRGSEHRDHGLDTLVEVDGDTVLALQTPSDQSTSERSQSRRSGPRRSAMSGCR